jgi:hypothetical protein
MYDAKGLHPNLDYPTGPAYHLIGFDTPTFTPIFAVARLPGWTAHIAEQLATNSLIRPLAAYDGTSAPHEQHQPGRSAARRFLWPRSKWHLAGPRRLPGAWPWAPG